MARYLCPLDLDFTTLTSGTVYMSFFNTDTVDIGINKITIQTMSATGSGNTKCMYALARASGTKPTGGSVVSYTKMDTDTPDVTVDISKNNAGLTVAGTVVDPYFMEIAIRTGSDGMVYIQEFDEREGFILYPNQGIVLLADGDGVSGASLHGCIEFNKPD